jgi:2-amino-4-ketopentanoate thiolase alpha subunit
MKTAKAGDWVQVHTVVLPPGERAPQVPADTQKVPFEMWLKGFLVDVEAQVGQDVTIETVVGRQLRGTLVAVNPAYPHSFGEPVPELLSIGRELRALIEEPGDE